MSKKSQNALDSRKWGSIFENFPGGGGGLLLQTHPMEGDTPAIPCLKFISKTFKIYFQSFLGIIATGKVTNIISVCLKMQKIAAIF